MEVEGLWLAERWWNTALLFKLVKDFMFLEYNLGDKLLLSCVKVRLDFAEHGEALNEKDYGDSR